MNDERTHNRETTAVTKIDLRIITIVVVCDFVVMCWFDLIWDFCVCLLGNRFSKRVFTSQLEFPQHQLRTFRLFSPILPELSVFAVEIGKTLIRTNRKFSLVFRSTSSHNNNDDETSLCHLCTPQHNNRSNNKNLHTLPTHHSSCFSTTATKIHFCSNFLRHTKKLLPYIRHSPTKQQYNSQQQHQQQFFIIIIINNNNQ